MFARTERLLLRPSWAEDAQEVYAGIADERIVRNLSRAPWPYTLRDAQEFTVREAQTHYPNFLLMQRTDGAPRLVGSCGLGEHENGVEIGYWIAQPFWGLGYATEAARAVVNIARALGHSKLIGRHFIDNPGSGRVLRKIGFRPTGKTAMLHSRGRAEPAPCVMYEQDLDEDSEGGVMPEAIRPLMPAIRTIMAAKAA